MDELTPFFNGYLNEFIYIQVAAGLKDPDRPHLAWRLLKTLYGLEQALKQWYSKIHEFLENELGLKSCPHETCLYVRHSLAIWCSLPCMSMTFSMLETLSELLLVKDEFRKCFKVNALARLAGFWVKELLFIVLSVLCICHNPRTSIKYLSDLVCVTWNPVRLL